MFSELIKIIKSSHENFDTGRCDVEYFINNLPNINGIIEQIGIIPEEIPHDSTEEKLFSKASDIILAKAFRELGLKSIVLAERADSADIFVESKFHNYTFVADAKAFRLSRTAKNQKDFKVGALSNWKKDSNYALLCAPYFQYPRQKSQIYAQALQFNVCLLSWEHILYLLENKISETDHINLSALWNFSSTYSQSVLVSQMKNNFLKKFDTFLLEKFLSNDQLNFSSFMDLQIRIIKNRATDEEFFWNEELQKISGYTREQAIQELINLKKITEKLNQINTYISGLSYAR